MTDISACSATQVKTKCVLRHACRRYDLHLNSPSKQQPYKKPQFPVNSDCENFIELNEKTFHANN